MAHEFQTYVHGSDGFPRLNPRPLTDPNDILNEFATLKSPCTFWTQAKGRQPPRLQSNLVGIRYVADDSELVLVCRKDSTREICLLMACLGLVDIRDTREVNSKLSSEDSRRSGGYVAGSEKRRRCGGVHVRYVAHHVRVEFGSCIRRSTLASFETQDGFAARFVRTMGAALNEIHIETEQVMTRFIGKLEGPVLHNKFVVGEYNDIVYDELEKIMRLDNIQNGGGGAAASTEPRRRCDVEQDEDESGVKKDRRRCPRSSGKGQRLHVDRERAAVPDALASVSDLVAHRSRTAPKGHVIRKVHVTGSPQRDGRFQKARQVRFERAAERAASVSGRRREPARTDSRMPATFQEVSETRSS
eukprot:364339-Chlamydomonas_euryale.AAC.1